MVKKEEILKDLRNDLNFEEDTIEKISSFYQVLGWKGHVTEEAKNAIQDGLAILKKDSEKHSRMINDMIRYIEESGKNEF